MCDPINCIIMSAKVQNKKHFLSLKSSVIADEIVLKQFDASRCVNNKNRSTRWVIFFKLV